MKKLEYGLAMFVLLLSMLTPGCGSKENEEEGTRSEKRAAIEVIKVKKGDLASFISVTGTLTPNRESRIGPKVEGRIEEIYVDVGDRVEKGQPLIKLEQRTYIIARNEADAALKTARANLVKAEVNLKNITRDLKRFSSALKDKVVSQQRHDDVDSDYTIAQAELMLAGAQVKEAEAKLAMAENNLTDTITRAPFSGFIVEKLMEEGEVSNWVTYLWEVLHLVDIEKVKIECRVSETKLPFLYVGKEAAVQVDAYPEEGFTGKIMVINNRVDPKSRTFLIKIEIPNPGFRLKGGMFCRVKIAEQEKRGVLQIPKEALLVKEGKHTVYKVDNGKASAQVVKLGISDGDWVEVIEGLNGTESIVIEGLYALTDGVLVEVIQ